MQTQTLTPHVYWAQRHCEVYVRVELSDVQKSDIRISENTLLFSARGHGAKGDNAYEFQLEFLEAVDPKPLFKVTERQVNITVKKTDSRWWDRLTKQEKKPIFLAPDFDRWLDESDAEMELREKEEERINQISVKSRVRKDPYITIKKGYLFMYNLVQFLGFSWIFVNMTVRLFVLGQDSLFDTFHAVGDVMYFCQIFAVLEIINPLLGLVKSGLVPAIIQVIGRNVILFVVIGTQEEMQNKAAVFAVFYLWSIIEMFRYPYYMLSCIDTEWKILTWIRYTIWIPLYPFGVIAEAVCVVQSIPHFDETGRFSIVLPNPFNISFGFSYFLQAYLILMFLGLFINFRHLYRLRNKRLKPRKRKMN
ncbi:very-long-chain (3R)-3-hydroxyacyl-CoA dehydratase [Callorhinchus milii]|uniref:Very-long-chain (3R)-3-hydroxyacyl-CoA dehydratase n=1 Tax=Callorhinchus milii TaxID=7868 RepID=V9L0T7_CALMI|nr:very-long-chain (3R)-3-hydroxyacyl-CoA dehydratase [Callorhinchus milii]|eukprot:gi/632938085/ref/XP_007903679.1/ PREDICTED: very-long-chain (3R)-3-hydroxyacyl-[acyl-carrier protein] dehydratase 3 [Callorhinchus milii]